MKNLYPENVTNKILEITLESQHFCFLSVSTKGELVKIGGKFIPSIFQHLNTGDQLLDQLPYITTFLSGTQNVDHIPSLDLGSETIVDAHFFRDNDLVWAIFLDKTSDIEWEKQARQKGNELRLLKANLNKTSESKNHSIDFFSALNTMALLRNHDKSFSLLQPASECFHEIYPECFQQQSNIYPQDKFLFLDNFLIDAEALWAAGESHSQLSSGPWIETGSTGNDIALEASAVHWDGHHILFIRKLSHDYQDHQNVLQIGREGVLIKNQLEDEVRKRTALIRAREEEIALRLVCAADKRDDGETGSHIRRLGLYSELMATHLGWTQDQIDEIRIAAPMHDIGKIGIPDNILRKPGKLTDEEFEIMKRHPVIGGQILSKSNSALVNMAQEICLGHHERWDGAGYPFGLSEEHIPISARIVAIVDVFDALIHKRVYKEKMTLTDAINLMKEGRGTHFDPKLFDLFISLSENMWQISEEYRDPPITDLTMNSH